MTILKIPSKTFIIGEYAILASSGCACLVATTPYFSFTTTQTRDNTPIYSPQSPVGRLLQHLTTTNTTTNQQPRPPAALPPGGLPIAPREYGQSRPPKGCGRSSAEFIATYAVNYLTRQDNYKHRPNIPPLDAWHALRYFSTQANNSYQPSGVDLVSQLSGGISIVQSMPDNQALINRDLTSQDVATQVGMKESSTQKTELIKPAQWPADLGFILIRSGITYTNTPLYQNNSLELDGLVQLSQEFAVAITQQDSSQIVKLINKYYHAMLKLSLINDEVQAMITQFQQHPNILAAKGCGGGGADTILLITTKQQRPQLTHELIAQGHHVLATEQDISNGISWDEK